MSKSLTDYQLSRKLAAEGKWEKALGKIRLCLASEPENRKYQRLFKQITLHLQVSRKLEQARELEQSGNFEQAVETYRTALESKTGYNKQLKALIKEIQRNQQEFEELRRQASQLYQGEKYSKAKVVAHRLLDITPHHQAIRKLVQEIENKEQSQILYSQAMALYKRSQFQPALEMVARSLELDPDFAAARILLAKIGSSQTCQRYQLAEEWKNRKKLQESIQLLEDSVEPADD